MTVTWTTFKKELASYLFSPVGYVVALLLYFFRGWEIDRLARIANAVGFDRDQFAAAYLQQQTSLILLVLVPAILTMRCFAEEKRTGSIEVLLTAPVRDAEVVVGKWAAAFVFFALLWAPAIVTLLALQGDAYLGVDLPAGPVFSGFLGVLLVGGLLLAAGCFTSSLTDNQLLASLSAMLFAFALWVGPAQLLPPGDRLGVIPPDLEGLEAVTAWLEVRVLQPVLAQANVFGHLQSWFFRGIVNSAHVVFYVSGTAFLLFLTVRSLEARRWR